MIRLTLDELRSRKDFRPFREGVEVAWLYGEGDSGPASALLRYAPNAHVPEHSHGGYEHILVLEGAQEDERGRYGVGTVVINEPGSQHRVRSPEGCLVLVIWEKRVTFLEDSSPEPTT